jgi:5-deoxy-D-glucuronate isomerase
MKTTPQESIEKPRGQIVVKGKVKLTELDENPIKHGKRLSFFAAQNPKLCLFAMAHTKFRTLSSQIHFL